MTVARHASTTSVENNEGAGRTLIRWSAVFAGTDACVAPILSPAEVAAHPHNAARRVFAEVGGVSQPQPAPRLPAIAPTSPTPTIAPIKRQPGRMTHSAG